MKSCPTPKCYLLLYLPKSCAVPVHNCSPWFSNPIKKGTACFTVSVVANRRQPNLYHVIGYVVVVAAVVFVLIFTHRYNAVRGHRAAIFPPHVYLRPSFLSSSQSQLIYIWGHVAGSSPPSPLRFVPFRLFMRRLQLFRPSSTHSRRIVPTRATRSINGPLSFSFCN